jgi:hypothetical protein
VHTFYCLHMLSTLLSFLLACFVRGFPLHLVSVRPFVALFIKWGENLFREGNNPTHVECMME